MMNMINAFRAPSRAVAEWFCVGPTSSFPNIETGDDSLTQPRTCAPKTPVTSDDNALAATKPGCKVFHVSSTDTSQRTELSLTDDAAAPDESSADIGPQADLSDQVLVFQYKGKFHAIDNKCPHSSFPLFKGVPFDIEDFGIVLSAGITCPKHGWSFDLFSGMADRGNYKLKVWEVQLRDVANKAVTDDTGKGKEEQEVWVRRKQRMG
ncbi:hypothetical protein B0H63DRAFT_193420 [Podospora didyma]|uniref:Rieske domain-containing protein n=1 Tax=Podospora didyma TaxID=330526 RepID=A0AAE0NFZ5_9PEZI|nr:hypothetical protein B0H63DRAFT_193420 [Podospora didyma]